MVSSNLHLKTGVYNCHFIKKARVGCSQFDHEKKLVLRDNEITLCPQEKQNSFGPA